ncbi:CLUMA_CG009296, isoform B [Clunio marinus]|uniref:CLUMA_CG009296, isoform B n=1 Tax=Clunio marinus TaxID=568069 RepID=A0A1J1IBN5_9DIPT|nr:CLUMA_CG009296, isoform B [Clunio marinus]
MSSPSPLNVLINPQALNQATGASQQCGNVIYMIRGASKTENGSSQIVIQNTQELLNLLNKNHSKFVINQNVLETSDASTSNELKIETKACDNVNNHLNLQHLSKDGRIVIKTLDKSHSFLVVRNGNRSSSLASFTETMRAEKEDSKTSQTNEVVKECGESVEVQKLIPIGSDGEPIKLPENLESLPRADHFPNIRHRWNTNEEIAGILINFDRHAEWQSKEVRTRPKSGSMLLYSRKKVRYRRDGYCWKKRKDGKTTREDHMKLKVQGTECIYGCYVHSAILPTFHRRCYWLLQNPDIVLVHYLNVPYPDDRTQHNKMVIPSILWSDKKEWTKEELLNQLKPMFFNDDDPEASRDIDTTSETVEAIVSQLIEKQRQSRQAALVKQLSSESCPEATCLIGKPCLHRNNVKGGGGNGNEILKRSDSVGQVSNNFSLETKQSYHRWYSERHINAKGTQEKSSSGLRSNKMESESMHSSFSLNNGSLISKSSYATCNLQLNNNSSNLSPNDAITNQQHAMMKSNNIINNTSECSNKVQLTANPNLNIFVSVSSNETNTHTDDIKNNSSSSGNSDNYKSHLMDGTQNFNLNNKQQHISCQQQQQQQQRDSSSAYNNNQMMNNNDMNGSTLPLNLCQVQQSNFFANGHHKPPQQPIMDEMSIKKEHDSPMDILGHHQLHHHHHEKEYDEDKKDESIFNTTLDLSQEDIQQTLSANMPVHRNEESIVNDTISFIENCSSSVQEEDDTFVNLDAFDMLIELPELESGKNNIIAKNSHDHSLHITEFCPDWSFVDGGVKILITGPWLMETTYTAYFDNINVPATVVQNGVLKLFAPKHEPGVCKVCISDGFSFSNMVDFEYKLQPNFEYGHIEILYKFSLQNRLEAINNELCGVKTETNDKNDNSNLFEDPDFENCLIQYCKKFTSTRQWSLSKKASLPFRKLNGMSILHLTAFLGYSNLANLLLKWSNENPHPLIRSEIDARSQNKDGNTPLMLAGMNGFVETAITLYKWDNMTLRIKNFNHKSMLDLCIQNNHIDIVNQINSFEKERRRNVSKIYENGFEDETLNENEEESDRIFLRPGAVHSPLNNLNKRTSLDFNHNTTDSRSTKSRSMSLPVTYSDLDLDNIFSSDQESSNSCFQSSNSSLLSPLRKTDFAFCEPKVLNLAEKIIAAIPKRIKNETDESMALDNDNDEMNILLNDTSFIDSNFEQQFDFAFNDYRYEENRTPCSSPASSASALQSPYSMQADMNPRSPPVTAKDFTQFFEASNPVSQAFEADFSELTLTDNEQRELYQAAKCIQKAYRSYKGRKKMEEKDLHAHGTRKDKEKNAAIIIQNYYRRYKEYAYYREMTHAALGDINLHDLKRDKTMLNLITVIQNKYRSYCESKRFKQSLNSGCDAVLSSTSLSTCDTLEKQDSSNAAVTTKDGMQNTSGLKRTYSQSTQNQAARKIQQFMLTAKNKLQRERAENERQARLRKELSRINIVSPDHQPDQYSTNNGCMLRNVE